MLFRSSKGKANSVMDQLETDGLARRIPAGQRQFWEVSEAGVARLAEMASTARPGPPPGAQVTLDAKQLAIFVSSLSRHARPEDAVREALYAATGISEGVDRIVIPITPRRPTSSGSPNLKCEQ